MKMETKVEQALGNLPEKSPGRYALENCSHEDSDVIFKSPERKNMVFICSKCLAMMIERRLN